MLILQSYVTRNDLSLIKSINKFTTSGETTS